MYGERAWSNFRLDPLSGKDLYDFFGSETYISILLFVCCKRF